MEPETIELYKELINMLGEAGNGAATILILWVLEGYFGNMIAAAVVISFLVVIYKLVNKLQPSLNFINDLRRELGLSVYGDLTRSERETIMEAVKRGKRKDSELPQG